MSDANWIELHSDERALLLNALATLGSSSKSLRRKIDALTLKLVHRASYPQVTVGVHGGQVQWTLGNPFPIRICDYDGTSDDDLPDTDERGQRCRIWWEPANDKANVDN
jgi:hypothetical protein